MSSFFSELKRRKVFKLAVVYLVVAWVLVQIVATVEAPLNLPDWVDTLVIVLLAIGFPIALIMSWAFDVTPAGLVRDREPDANTEPVEPATSDTSEVATETATDVLPNSVAVLPFENLSPDPDDAYFAAGIHEEILNQLAKIKDLSVIARTSVLPYTDSGKSIPEIAGELRVETVMEGTVRYAGDQVRITTQLIDADSGAHLWSDAYDRELKDIFAIQTDIATNITNAVRAELSVAEQKQVEKAPTESLEAYGHYLRAMAIAREGDGVQSVTAPDAQRSRVQSLLDQAVAVDPEFAIAYAYKAFLYALSKPYGSFAPNNWIEGNAELDTLVRRNAEKALSIDPGAGLAQGALALMYQFNWRETEARAAFEKSLRLNPNDPNILSWLCALNWWTDRTEDAIRLARQAMGLDPNNSLPIVMLGFAILASGDAEGSADVFRNGLEVIPTSAHLYSSLATAAAALRNDTEALEACRIAEQLLPDAASPYVFGAIGWAYGVSGQHESTEMMSNKVYSVSKTRYVDPGGFAMTQLSVRDCDKAYESLALAAENRSLIADPTPIHMMRINFFADPVLEEPRFVELRQKLKYTQA